ncbi:hypothetical protein SAMN05421505_108117 [Sinosporangium album]|uniref:Metal binding domain of Ada n=1 Tax=Sinosporangium album TaxID=504805 RepID=A0A1G7XBA1_9ACTN|nr:hypothetical protein [Sinosporangium album]SDG81476.1 hypothetical protein SAMN05421505_108117 [Sinosporangium album]
MILVSAGLVLAAIVLLIAGIVLGKVFLVMWSIVLSVLSAVFLVIAALLWRHKLFPGGGRADAEAPAPHLPGAPPAHAHPGGFMGAPTTTSVATPSMGPSTHRQAATITATHSRPHPSAGPLAGPAPSGISPDAIVLVVPGRKRYHAAGCRQLIGKQLEQLTYEEARDEGFSPCTTCLPDAALGGRQLPSVADPDTPSPESTPPTTGTASSAGPSEAAHFPADSGDLHRSPGPSASSASPGSSGASGLSAEGPLTSSGPSAFAGSDDSPAFHAPSAGSGDRTRPPGSSGGSGDLPGYTATAIGSADLPGYSGYSGTAAPSETGSPSAAHPAGAAGSTSAPLGSGALSDWPDSSPTTYGSGDRGGSPSLDDPRPHRAEPPAVPGFTPPIIPPATSRSTGGWFASKGDGPQQQNGPSAGSESLADSGSPAYPGQDQPDAAATAQGLPAAVTVISGTHRYHDSSCPIVRATEESALDTMLRQEAVRGGFTACSICQH